MLDDLLPEVEQLRSEGAVVLLKWDGERKSQFYTVVITRRDTDYVWRTDTDNIAATLFEGLTHYRTQHQ